MELTLENARRLFESMEELARVTYLRLVERYGEESEDARRELNEFGTLHNVNSLLNDPAYFTEFCKIHELEARK